MKKTHLLLLGALLVVLACYGLSRKSSVRSSHAGSPPDAVEATESGTSPGHPAGQSEEEAKQAPSLATIGHESQTTPPPAPLPGKTGAPHAAVPAPISKLLPPSAFNGITGKDQPLELALPDGKRAVGVVEHFEADAAGKWVMVEGRLSEPAAGRFLFRRQPAGTPSGAYAGAIRFPLENYGYTFETSAAGEPQLTANDADSVSCVNYSKPEQIPAADPEQLLPIEHPTNVPIPAYQNGVIPLQSLPGATGVLYMDFDGEQGPFNGWGDFNAAPSGASNSQIIEVWSRVAEDYAPFNINVTTDLQIYLNAPETSRQRCIITPTNNAAPGAGGVAYIGSWNWGGDTPCWAFYTNGKASAEVVSHEVGHTLGLGHDGRVAEGASNAEDYYGGHGNGDTGWAPIMGVGYYQNLSQWSKGEYARANQMQDDLAVIEGFNAVDFRADDHGDTPAAADPLELFGSTVNDDGIIGTRTDIDAFSFTTTGGNATLAIKPVVLGPDLDISAEIRNSSNVVVASSNPDLGIDANFNLTLPAGTYTILIDGVGRGSATGDGYTDYASLGFYTIDGTITGAISPDRFTVNEFPPLGSLVGTVTPDNNHAANPLTYTIISGNGGGAFAIGSSTGTLTVANPNRFDHDILSRGWNDPADFELLVQLSDATQPGLNETLRVIVTVNDNGATAPAILKHRYSFTGNATDSIGAADLTLVGGAAVSGGQLDLPGGGTRLKYATAQGAALTKLAATINGSSALTIEGWFNQDAAQNWAKVFMAGLASGDDYLDVTPRRGADENVSSMSIRNNADGETHVLAGTPLANDVTYYFAAIWDQASDRMTLNIGPVGGSLSTYTAAMGGRALPDIQIAQFFIGAPVFFGDPDFDGQVDEFRIWSGALGTARIAGDFAAGPNAPGDSDLDGLPDAWELSFAGVTSLSDLNGNLYAGRGPGAGSGDFDGDGLSDYDEYHGGSGGTNPADTDSDNDGYSDLSERNAGSNPNDAGSQPAATLAHRYAFNSGGIDAIGSADLTLTGTATVTGGVLDLPGGASRTNQANAQGAALTEVAATINNAYALSVETWFKQDVAQNWSKVLMAGKGFDSNYIDITPRRGVDGNVSSTAIDDGGTESVAIGGPAGAPLVNGTKYYCAAIWNPLNDQVTLRIGPVGGSLSTFTASMGGKKLSQLLVNEFRIGAAVQFGDPDFDGQIDEVRIWKGVLSPAQSSANFASGPGQPAGDLDGDGLPDQWELSFAGINHLHDLSPSGDYDGDGLLNAAEYAAGSSPVDSDSDDDGFSDAAEVAAGTNPANANSSPVLPAAVLAHRYSFTGNANDSVGTAHLGLTGSATVTGGKLNLPGGAARSSNASAQGAALSALAGTINGASSLTIEGWFSQDVAQDWSKILMLGQESGGNYLDITPHRGIDGGISSISINPGTGEAHLSATVAGAPLATATPYYFAATWDPSGDRLVLRIGPAGGALETFVGSMGGKTLAALNIGQFFIGSAVSFGDPDFDGQLDELRIWKGSLTRSEVIEHFSSGPDLLGTDPMVAGTSMNSGGTAITLALSTLTVGQTYHVETSTNLLTFTPLAGSQFTADSIAKALDLPIDRSNFPNRFFRLVKGPLP